MAENQESPGEVSQGDSGVVLERGTYEILRNRLVQQSDELRRRLEQLNAARKEAFGAVETALLRTERITTAHNCHPRDMVAVGTRVLFGYNVHLGLKTETELSDVFGVYELREEGFHECALDLIADDRFRRDFGEVYRYYRGATFSRFALIGPHLYMLFQIGKSPDDIKAFKWLIEGERITYLDNRSDHEVQFPAQHDFDWRRTTRDMHRHGMHPHISIDDRVFVETVGGDLTIKVENNTDSGEGIYAEEVENADQTLDDAEVHYALVGNLILLKIRPYQESASRYFLFNEKIKRVLRLDTLRHSCVLLPDDHGLVFPNGYYLQSGEHKTFDFALDDMQFVKRIGSPNGEDHLYVFLGRETGTCVLLQYNVIEQQVATPLICHGYTLLHDGRLICFKAQEIAQKHHPVQIWQTPYTHESHVPESPGDSYVFKIGNRDIVRAMAECHEVLNLIGKEDSYAGLYDDLVKQSTDIVDSYFWIGREEMFRLKEPLEEIRQTASAAIEEYEKVVRVRRHARDELARVRDKAREILSAVNRRQFQKIGEFVSSLADLRAVRGEVIALKEVRYIDDAAVEALEEEVVAQTEQLSNRCVSFLLRDDALQPYVRRVDELRGAIDGAATVADCRKLEKQLDGASGDLELLVDIVSNLKIDDATKRTTIIDNISVIFATVNQVRAALKSRVKSLQTTEGAAEFNSQLKLLNQSVVNYLDVCDSPQKCEEYLTRVMIQVEELEARFAEFEEFVAQLTEKREEIYNAFESRRLALVEARNRRAAGLQAAADRILTGIRSRAATIDSAAGLHAYFASDLMVEKVRNLVAQLQELGDTVKVEEIQNRLKSLQEESVRQLKDRQDLYSDGGHTIALGGHRFAVNQQALELTTVVRDDALCLHLTGTNFFAPVKDARLDETREVWHQEFVSENEETYRGEYLAWLTFQMLGRDGWPGSRELAAEGIDAVQSRVAAFMAPRYAEGYVKGVHDHDAALILHALAEIDASAGLLRFQPRARALGALFWLQYGDKPRRKLLAAKLAGFGTLSELFPDRERPGVYIAELAELLGEFVRESELFPADLVGEAAEYLFQELCGGQAFVVSRTAADVHEQFRTHVSASGYSPRFEQALKEVHRDVWSAFQLLRDWVGAFIAARGPADAAAYVDEAAYLLLQGSFEPTAVVSAATTRELTGLSGNHRRISEGRSLLNYHEFCGRLTEYRREVEPRFRQFAMLKKAVIEQSREEMRLEEFKPRVLTSFVRNRLLDTVYLPLIGNNLAKQIGVSGEQKRTDRMGLLLLISPPGYGKTTLMEYVANRLGLIFMKINGPAIGHQVTSLDPAEAPNAAAREEVEKLNLALEMGDNVMLYLDDIQHCHPELLQKFISLCDAQRRIEGVYQGRSQTYDLRGRRVAVVMAGNPYTESGGQFKIPDMLANRADVYNLGEIIGDSREAFEMSYLENCLTSNSALNRLAVRSPRDVYVIMKMARGGLEGGREEEGLELEGRYTTDEVAEMVAVMQKLTRVREIILKVNREYIRSAAQSNDYRTEPPFKLQGSYRNMNRIAERVAAVMNDAELTTLILSNYENDAQTLTSDTEANLLKFKELMGILSEDEQRRWDDIKKTFRENVALRGLGPEDKIGQAIVELRGFGEGLQSIRDTVASGLERFSNGEQAAGNGHGPDLIEQVRGLRTGVETLGDVLVRLAGLAQAASERSRTKQGSTSPGSENGGSQPE